MPPFEPFWPRPSDEKRTLGRSVDDAFVKTERLIVNDLPVRLLILRRHAERPLDPMLSEHAWLQPVCS